MVKISTKGRYGIMALVELAGLNGSEAVTLKKLSQSLNLSEGYLEQIFSSLRKNGLVSGRKGAQGGYVISKPLGEITVGQILRVLEGNLNLVEISGDSRIGPLETSLNSHLWAPINETIHLYFESMTLEQLVGHYKKEKEAIVYFI